MILDTNALSAFAENDQSLLAALPTDRPWYLPVVVVGEYRFGLRGSQERANREQWLRELIVAVTVLPITESTTEHYATVRHDLKAANRQIPPNDAWIAALALEHGSRCSVATRISISCPVSDGSPGSRSAGKWGRVRYVRMSFTTFPCTSVSR